MGDNDVECSKNRKRCMPRGWRNTRAKYRTAVTKSCKKVEKRAYQSIVVVFVTFYFIVAVSFYQVYISH